MLRRPFVVGVVAALAAAVGSFQGGLRRVTVTARRGAASGVVSDAEALDDGIAMLRQKDVFTDEWITRELSLFNLRNSKAPKFVNARERLIRLMRRKRDVELDGNAPDELHRWDRKEFPGYDCDVTSLLDRPQTLVQRQQLTGLCYLHAVVVVQYYAIWFAKLKDDANVISDHLQIDMTALILKTFDGPAMENYIFRDFGGSSQQALKNILQPGSIVSAGSKELAPELLSKYGPALVSNFKVHEDFLDRNVHEHYGQPIGDIEGMLAMALVGSRCDPKTGNVFFLLQNWWSTKQFVEVDLEYLEACGATLYYVKTPQFGVPETFPTHTGHIMQTEAIDMHERYALEGPLKPEPAWMIAERAAAMARLREQLSD